MELMSTGLFSGDMHYEDRKGKEETQRKKNKVACCQGQDAQTVRRKNPPAFGLPVDCLLAAFFESYANEVFESLLQTPKGEGLFSVHVPDFPEIKARIRLDDILKKQKGAGRSDCPLKFVFQEP